MKKLLFIALVMFSCSKEKVEPVQLWQCSCKTMTTDGYIIEFPNITILRTESGMREFEKAGTVTDANGKKVTQCTAVEK